MTAPQPYYADDAVTVYHGDMREILPHLDMAFDCVISDPPYAETTLRWDRWPDAWPSKLTTHTTSLWCFGSMRMFLDRRDQFDDWRFGQDLVWEKHNGSSFAADRFKRVHEHVVHWYRGPWHLIQHDVPRLPRTGPKVSGVSASSNRAAHTGAIGLKSYEDDGTRLARSVLSIHSMHGRAIHPTEKPVELISHLIHYSSRVDGVVLDPFAGSGATAVAARLNGRKAVLIEANEQYCDAITRRLNAPVQLVGGAE